jgi:hypothetical protein
VAKVVLCLSSLASSTPWYPSMQSRVDLSFPAGTELAISAADLVLFDSCLPAPLSLARSTVLLALPFLLGYITMREHHVSASAVHFPKSSRISFSCTSLTWPLRFTEFLPVSLASTKAMVSINVISSTLDSTACLVYSSFNRLMRDKNTHLSTSDTLSRHMHTVHLNVNVPSVGAE